MRGVPFCFCPVRSPAQLNHRPLYDQHGTYVPYRPGLFNTEPLNQPSKLLRRQLPGFRFLPRPLVAASLQPLVQEQPAVSFKIQGFHAITTPPAEQEQTPRAGIQLEYLLHYRGEAIDLEPHIGIAAANKDIVGRYIVQYA